MTAPRIGLSSGTVPELGAADFVAKLLDVGGDAVDLRAGKGHRWEEEGLQPFLEAGVQVAFIGLGTALGDERWDETAIREAAAPFAGFPLKVFAKIGCMDEARAAFTARQVQVLAELAGGAERVLAETHHGCSGVDELIRLHEATGAHLLLDTMGLARITDDPEGDAERLAPIVRAVQVKGFDWQAPGESRHLPLSATDLSKTEAILRYVRDRAAAVTVETRAGSAQEDVRVLKNLL